MTLRDPYVSETYELELSEAKAKQKQHGEPLGAGAFVICTVLVIAVGALIGGLTYAVTMGTGHEDLVGGLVTAITSLVMQALLIKWHIRDHRIARTIKDLEAKSSAIDCTRSAEEPMNRLASSLRALPQERREELRPLWDAALEANAVLFEFGYEEALMRRITDRADAVEQYLKSHRELESQARAAEREMKRAAALSSLDASDQDLELVKIYTESLDEGKRRYQELRTGSNNDASRILRHASTGEIVRS